MGKDQDLLDAARSGNVVLVEKLLSSKSKRGGPLARFVFFLWANLRHSESFAYISTTSAAIQQANCFDVCFCKYFKCSLRRGPGVNVQDTSGYSSLHHAALNGHR